MKNEESEDSIKLAFLIKLCSALFFIVYFIVVVWLGTNIMTAVILEAYVSIVEKREQRTKAREERAKTASKTETDKNAARQNRFGGTDNDGLWRKSSGHNINDNKNDNNNNNNKSSNNINDDDELNEKRNSSFCVDLFNNSSNSNKSSGDEIKEIKKSLKKDSIITQIETKNAPQFKDFDPEEDLETPEVIALLQEEVTRTHQRLRRNSTELQSSFRRTISSPPAPTERDKYQT